MSSILAGRSAGKEAAYFFEESKQAVSRLADKLPKNPPSDGVGTVVEADILPEVLQHKLPAKLYRTTPNTSATSYLSNYGKWAISNSSNASVGVAVSPDVLNPLRSYVSLPQVTFGPKRWQLPASVSSITASTANDLREHAVHINPDQVRAAAQGLAHIGKAFAVATFIIFGSAALTFGFAASKLDVHSIDDIRTKGKGFVQPKLESLNGQLAPLKDWAETTSKKWHIKNDQDIKERPIVKELSKILGTKDST